MPSNDHNIIKHPSVFILDLGGGFCSWAIYSYGTKGERCRFHDAILGRTVHTTFAHARWQE